MRGGRTPAIVESIRTGLKTADAKQVYDRLIATSQRHLAAFQA